MSPTLTVVDPSGEVGVMVACARGRARRGARVKAENFIVAIFLCSSKSALVEKECGLLVCAAKKKVNRR